MIQLNNLTKTFGPTIAVNNVSILIPRGQILGYLGANGAGKTTTVKMIAGLLQPSSGAVLVDGYDVTKQPIEAKRRIGYVPESGGLYESLTAFEYLQMVGRLYHLQEAAIQQKINAFAEFFDLKPYLRKRISQFSKGMKQKVLISAALIHNPEILLLDEPFASLDATTVNMIKQLIRNLTDCGKTIFMCSHMLDTVERICDRFVILDKGKIVADGDMDSLHEITKSSSLEQIFMELTNTGAVEKDVDSLIKVIAQ